MMHHFIHCRLCNPRLQPKKVRRHHCGIYIRNILLRVCDLRNQTLFFILVVKISFSDLNFGEKVGSGGFGTVFKGHWKSKGLDVAIKRLQTQIRKEEVSLHIQSAYVGY